MNVFCQRLSLSMFVIILSGASIFGQASIDEVNPNKSARNKTVDVVITGINTNFGQATSSLENSVWFSQATWTGGYRITPNSVTLNSKTRMVVNITLPPNMPVDYYDLYTINGFDGLLTKYWAFEVIFGVGIPEFKEKYDVNIFPLPIKDNMIVSMTLNEDHLVNIEIFDLQGRSVYVHNYGTMSNGYHELTLNMNQLNLNSGSYILKMNVDENAASWVIPVE